MFQSEAFFISIWPDCKKRLRFSLTVNDDWDLILGRETVVSTFVMESVFLVCENFSDLDANFEMIIFLDVNRRHTPELDYV